MRTRDAHCECLREWQIDGALRFDGIVVAESSLRVSFLLLQRRALGIDEDGAAGGVGAYQSALRTAQHLDALQVVERVELDDRRLEQAVDIGGNAGGGIR